MTSEELKKQLYYHADSGDFVHLLRRRRGINWVGKQAGAPDSRGYIVINLLGHCYAAHRLAWLYAYGRPPIGEIDHINRNKSDNRLSNLREVTRSQNQRNTGLSKANKTGFKGIVERRYGRRWHASIRINGKVFHLGAFSTKEEAAAAYQRAVPHQG